MSHIAAYVTEHRYDFQGGYCTAYLTKDVRGVHFIHTITRMDGGSHIKTDPFEVSPVGDHSGMLKRTAELIPLT